ncbi:DUF1002 domain-containing protein [Thermohalobacter berrensis]|uniref:DUF1002 domain-containing protein n=1 Tax=Thermohalobacter berrensis TaxID=99594 RepID=A0A419T8M3_9FIRM|nr:DUF1002 domain-containing protein [Thermohalobacter berrensis]RKD33809.1 hypothetical protein BET03_08785 [Thermohalobacter berrensis]
MVKKVLSISFIFLLIFNLIVFSQAKDDIVVSLGEDLTEEEKQQMLNLFNTKEDIRIITVSNEEERRYLGKYINENVIGTRAISSAFVEKLDNGEGIKVETYNITWVTKEMYMNALVTAGIKDAKVKVAAPINVSGTAALTGIIKAFEKATGLSINTKKKEVANKEIAKTGKLGQQIGKDNASQLIKEVKEEVINRNLRDEKEIRKIIIEISGKLDINLNENQVNEIVDLMKDISRLNLDLKEVKNQLKGISDKVKEIAQTNREVKSILEVILDFLRRIFTNIMTKLNNLIQ